MTTSRIKNTLDNKISVELKEQSSQSPSDNKQLTEDELENYYNNLLVDIWRTTKEDQEISANFDNLDFTPELKSKPSPSPLNKLQLNADRRWQPKSYLPNLPTVLHHQFIEKYLKNSTDSVSLARSCARLYSTYQPLLDKLHPPFLRAVVDDDITTVRSILDTDPRILLHRPQKELIIESKCTWRKINVQGENALTIAAKQRQIEMFEILISYVNKLQDHKLAQETIVEAYIKWPTFEDEKNKGEFNIPDDYRAELETLVDVFKNETFPNGKFMEAYGGGYNKLSYNTEEKLHQFRNLILPKKAVTLDQSIQVELLLYAAYDVYVNHFKALKDWEKQIIYCSRVIGFIQTLLTPSDAEQLCKEAMSLRPKERAINLGNRILCTQGMRFYRTSRDNLSKIGGIGWVDLEINNHELNTRGAPLWTLEGAKANKDLWKKECQNKTKQMEILCAPERNNKNNHCRIA